MNIISRLIDTIVSVSTPRGVGAIGIIRLSGSKAFNIANKILKKKLKPRHAETTSFYDKNGIIIDIGLSLYFKKPYSFTGEDVIEFHTHGSNLILNSLMNNIIFLGARTAMPGEFSFRAFYNNKIDLVQAESINALIKSNSMQYNNLILKSLSGAFSNEINKILDMLLFLRRDIDAFIEFPDDVFLNFEDFKIKLNKLNFNFSRLFDKVYKQFFINYSFKILILGDVNVGKSSLFNLLLKKDRAIISSTPGTTRDFIEDDFNINNVIFKLVDTAGFNNKTKCLIEKNGIIKTFEQIDTAFIIIFMLDAKNDYNLNENGFFKYILNKFKNKSKFFVLKNKIDLYNIPVSINYNKDYMEIFISVKNGNGINLFKKKLNNFLNNINQTSFMLTKRHFDLFIKCKAYIENTIKCIDKNISFDICAENLKISHEVLSEIIGKKISNDVLDKIFSDFCIGK